jgi:4-hydroxy-tetrahydrodipicolinate reductase
MIRVVVNGALGRMGRATVAAVEAAEDLDLVGRLDVEDDLAAGLRELRPDVTVDFTVPAAAAANLTTILEAGVPAVVGTTGFTPEDLAAAERLCAERSVGAVVAPNFAIGAVLLMRFAAEAARHFARSEILELHHDGKVDAPSGTALRTAELMAESRGGEGEPEIGEESLAGVRGGPGAGGIRIHSARLPGLVAHQEVILGGTGQTLRLRHDTLDRTCFMPGVLLAVRRVRTLSGLVRDLGELL